ncbi:UMP kinase [Thermopetrobacter sp. TC1]|uniref:UMP kinase n=1 Tax=Thermopetrobacter sp. TC1 TaxID=1495045 RepID=UPI00056F9980|nr:UMP kinase [Thermopetrobacter sp. TC1]
MTGDVSFKRILLKISGEALMGARDYGLDMDMVDRVAGEIAQAHAQGHEIGLVIGGGNIFRGLAGAAAGMERASADYMGMLATVMNALAMQNALHRIGVDARVMSAIPMPTVCESFARPRAVRHLEKGRVVIFAAGTGNPYFTTDTGAALRAAEMGCDALFKGTSVDGIYSDDPKKNPDAERFDTISYDEILKRNLKVMDAAAIALARDNRIPLVVFSIREEGMLPRVIRGEGRFTLVTPEEE